MDEEPDSPKFEGTFPYLILPDVLMTTLGRLEGSAVVPAGSPPPPPFVRVLAPSDVPQVSLTGQEFTLFRITRAEDVAELVDAYGMLGMAGAAADVDPGESWPLWYRLLGVDPDRDGDADGEPIEDWLRQGALIDFALALIALRRDQEARAEFEAAMQDRLATPAWSAARRMGRVLWRRRNGALTMNEPPAWRLPEWQTDRAGPFRFDLSDEGLDSAIRELLNPWLGRLRPRLLEQDGRTVAGFSLPLDLLGLLWLQLANAYLTEVPPRTCAWEGCPGPPKRPGTFFWRWGTGIKHRDAEYCTDRCKGAAVKAASRQKAREKAENERRVRERRAEERRRSRASMTSGPTGRRTRALEAPKGRDR